MPNIMLTYRCNLHCSYCFANEFVNKNKTDITMKNFLQALSFITKDEKSDVGLIGGEPTLHPGFREIMEILILNPRVYGITLFTNGLLMNHFISQIRHPKVRVLINCNSPSIIGERAFTNIQKALDTFTSRDFESGKIRLGINLYDNNMDYSFIVDLLRRYNLHCVRISLTVPDFSTCGEMNVLDYFRNRKEFLLSFFHRLDSIKVLPILDCNNPPHCIWTADEKRWLETFVAKYPDYDSNLSNCCSRCYPSVDILPNLQAVRCFGMSDFVKVPITQFNSIADIYNYFQNEIDSNAYKLSACEECKDCYERKVRRCMAGCIGFKASRINRCNEAIALL